MVIDGASTDGSRDWLETQQERIASLLSVLHGGIYDAMNKGLSLARGHWVLFLGADDILVDPMVLARLALMLVTTEADVIMANSLR